MQAVCFSVTFFFHSLPPFVCHDMLLSRVFPPYLFTGIFVFFLPTFIPAHTVVSRLYLDVSTGKRHCFPPSISAELSGTTEEKQFRAAEAFQIEPLLFKKLGFGEAEYVQYDSYQDCLLVLEKSYCRIFNIYN